MGAKSKPPKTIVKSSISDIKKASLKWAKQYAYAVHLCLFFDINLALILIGW